MVVGWLVTKSYPTLATPWTGAWRAPIHGILQVRILEWVAISFSRGPNWPKDQTCISCIAGRFFTIYRLRNWGSKKWTCPKSQLIVNPGLWTPSPLQESQMKRNTVTLLWKQSGGRDEMGKSIGKPEKNLRIEKQVRSLGWEDLLGEEIATHSSILAWTILVGYSPRGSKESDTT